MRCSFYFKKYLAKPFLKFIKDEKQSTEDREKLMVKAKAMEEKLKESEKTMKAALKKESDAQIQEAKESAQKSRLNCLKRRRQRSRILRLEPKKQFVQEQAEMRERG